MEVWSSERTDPVRIVGAPSQRERCDGEGPRSSRRFRERLLRIAAETRANVLLTGDTAGGRRYFESRYPEGVLRVMTARALNDGGPGLIRADGDRETVFFLDGVEELDSWVQSALVDFLEGRTPVGEGSRPPKVISASRVDLARLVDEGMFHGPLYLRLATLSIHLPGGWSTRSSRLRARPSPEWTRHGLRS